jgi:hypothetical protein
MAASGSGMSPMFQRIDFFGAKKLFTHMRERESTICFNSEHSEIGASQSTPSVHLYKKKENSEWLDWQGILQAVSDH